MSGHRSARQAPNPDQAAWPPGCPGPELARLAGLDPGLYATVMAATARAVPPRIAEALASYMELAEARALLDGLRRTGATDIAIAGFSPLVQELLKTGGLDGFRIAGIHTDTPVREFYGYARPELRLSPMPEAAPEGVTMLAASGEGRSRFPQALALPERAAERRANVFDAEARAAYPELFAPARRAALEGAEAVFLPGRTLLFAGVYTYFNFSRFSLALRKRGWRTVYLCLNASNTAHHAGHFDAVIHAAGDIELFYALLSALPWAGVHFQAWLGLHPFAAAAATLNPERTVVEFNDLPSYILPEQAFDTLFEAGQYAREQAAIRAITARARATVFNLARGGEEHLLRQAPAKGPTLCFHSYPLADFFAPDAAALPAGEGPLRLVFAGSLGASNLAHSAFGDIKLFGLIGELARQGLGFDIFLNPYQFADPKGLFWDYFHLARQEPLFRIHPGVPPEELPGRLAAAGHFGSMVYRYPEGFEIDLRHFACMMPSKFFSYMEAGLPVVVNSEFTGIRALVEAHGLGLVLGQEDIPRLGELLRAADLPALRRNVAAYREANGMDARIGELAALYPPLG